MRRPQENLQLTHAHTKCRNRLVVSARRTSPKNEAGAAYPLALMSSDDGVCVDEPVEDSMFADNGKNHAAQDDELADSVHHRSNARIACGVRIAPQ